MEILIGGIFPYLAVLLFLIGASYRIILWTTAPRKLNWRLYPVPESKREEYTYMGEEILTFRALFKHNRALWIGSYPFHIAMAVLFLWFILFLLGLSIPWLVRVGAGIMLLSCLYLLFLF